MCLPVNIMKFLRNSFFTDKPQETASAFLFKFFPVDLLIFLTRFRSSAKKCLFVRWFLIQWVIIAICFWQYIFNENFGSPISWFFKATFLLWVKSLFPFSLCFFVFIVSLLADCNLENRLQLNFLMMSIWGPGLHYPNSA